MRQHTHDFFTILQFMTLDSAVGWSRLSGFPGAEQGAATRGMPLRHPHRASEAKARKMAL